MMSERIVITGGGGFIGSRMCEMLIRQGKHVTCYDSLDPKTVNPFTVLDLAQSPNFELVRGDLLDVDALTEAFNSADAIIHAAAISSVDRSIRNPVEAIETNTIGTLNVMEAARKVGVKRVHYLSTDEVFGHAINDTFSEISPMNSRNPYAAGKAGGEAIVLAWGTTFGMEVTVTNSVNTFGPYQTPEKLIPRLTVRGILGNTLPVYGGGKQVREWLYVDDHVKAVLHILNHGDFGERYCVGSGETRMNIEIVHNIIKFLGLSPAVMQHVVDRPGHDLRYAIDSSKIRQLGWMPESLLEEALKDTIEWYRQNEEWWRYFLVIYDDLAPFGKVEVNGSQGKATAA